MGTVRFLIVDDQASYLEVLRETIGSGLPGWEVAAEATDGHQALERLASSEVDVVLMDLIMPGLDGAAATREIKRRFPSVKVLLISGAREPELEAECLRAGADAFLPKAQLSTGLRRWVETWGLGRGPTRGG